MNTTILQTLFLDNPEIPVEIAKFCNTLPEYVQAEQDYNRAAQELRELIGFERYSAFESVLNWHLRCELQACYLFGLGLKKDIISGIVQ